MSPPPEAAPGSPAARLFRDPHRFAFDAAIRVLLHRAGTPDPGEAARFRAPPHLGYPGAEILSATDGDPPTLGTAVIALTGATGVLPRGYTEQVTAATRERSPSLPAFIDLLASRLVGHFARAGMRYRPGRALEEARLGGPPEPLGGMLLALTGHATPGIAERLGCGTEAIAHYGGLFATRPRSAARLSALVSDWLGRPVEVEEFVGQWLTVPRDQQTRLPARADDGAFCQLGRPPGAAEAPQLGAALGTRFWDVQGQIRLRVGPLDRATFDSLLPGGRVFARLVALGRSYLGLETDFVINPVLSADAVPALRLEGETESAPGPRLGWNTWLPGGRGGVAADAIFTPALAETG